LLDEFINIICARNDRLLPNSVKKHYQHTSIRIDVSDLNQYRAIDWAEIRIPNDFLTTDKANIYVDKKYCLKIPHVESDGKVCVGDGDLGAFLGEDPANRIGWLITNFQNDFILPWNDGQLDYDFIKEPISYWNIYVYKRQSSRSAVKHVYLDEHNPKNHSIIEGKLLSNSKTIVVTGAGNKRLSELINSISPGDTLINVDVLIVNIEQPYSPSTWPRTDTAVLRDIRYHAGIEFTNEFIQSQKLYKSKKYHLVIFNHIDNQYGYLLSNGPRKVEKDGTIYGRTITRNIIQNSVVPLQIKRIDQNWIVGRDTIPVVNHRSNLSILIVGCGALGGFIINHLAQSGVGHITIVDHDMFEAENISRHSLGLNSIKKSKVVELKRELEKKSPHCIVNAFTGTFIGYANKRDINEFDLIVDVTGEDSVAIEIQAYRGRVSLVKAWMEPYVSAAHVCYFPPTQHYQRGFIGRLKCADWPSEVMTKLPGCSSYFQSYTVTSAAFGVAMTSELIMEMIDEPADKSIVRTWLREENYFSKFNADVKLSDWTKNNALQYGQVIDRDINE
jgi:tRNA A37 threonylcarbamoyladenosine dehydratase